MIMLSSSEFNLLEPLEIRKLLLNNLEKPAVLKKYLHISKKWKCVKWQKGDWIKLFGDQILNVRFGKKIKNGGKLSVPQWESDSLRGKMKFEEILKWEKSESPCQTLCNEYVTCDKYWAYFDYYYMKDLKDLSMADYILAWEELGFPNISAANSVLWIGTGGANTPLHFDTYGCNIVCQIYGKKHWTLFPKNQSQYLYPTRIPYEESSVYSKIGFPVPDMDLFPEGFKATPYMVTLEAGDVLLVPKHWWHFVENIDFSISISSWIELPSDPLDRLREAFVMYSVGSLCQSITCPTLIRDIFNPNMFDIATMTSSELLTLLIDKVSNHFQINSDNSKDVSEPSIRNVDLGAEKYKCNDGFFAESNLQKFNVMFLKAASFTTYLQYKKIDISKDLNTESVAKYSSLNKDQIFKLLIEVFTNDRVIDTMLQILEEDYNRKEEQNLS